MLMKFERCFTLCVILMFLTVVAESSEFDYSIFESNDPCAQKKEIPVDLWNVYTIDPETGTTVDHNAIAQPPIIESFYNIKYDLTEMGCGYDSSQLVAHIAELNSEFVEIEVSIEGVRVVNEPLKEYIRLLKLPAKYLSEGRVEPSKYVLDIVPDLALNPEWIIKIIRKEHLVTEQQIMQEKNDRVRADTLASVFDDQQYFGGDEKSESILPKKYAKAPAKAIERIKNVLEDGFGKDPLAYLKNISVNEKSPLSFSEMFNDEYIQDRFNKNEVEDILGEEPYLIGWDFYLEGDYRKAIETFKPYTENSSINKKLYHALALAYLAVDDKIEAMYYLKKVLNDNLDEALAHSNVGVLYYEMGEDERALKYLKKALGLNSAMVGLHQYMGYGYLFQGDYQTALYHLKMSVNYTPDDPSLCVVLGDTYSALGDSNNAILLFKRALRINTKQIEAYVSLANMYNQIGQHRNSLELLYAGLQHLPRSPDIHAYLGYTHVALKDYREAKDNFNIAKDLYANQGNQSMVNEIDQQLSLIPS